MSAKTPADVPMSPSPVNIPDQVTTAADTILPITRGADLRQQDPRGMLRRAADGVVEHYGKAEQRAALHSDLHVFVDVLLMGDGYTEGMAAPDHPPNHAEIPARIATFLRMAPRVAAVAPVALASVDIDAMQQVLQRLLDVDEALRIAQHWARGLDAVKANLEGFLYQSAKVVHTRTEQALAGFSLNEELKDFRRLFTDPADQAQETRKKLQKATDDLSERLKAQAPARKDDLPGVPPLPAPTK